MTLQLKRFHTYYLIQIEDNLATWAMSHRWRNKAAERCKALHEDRKPLRNDSAVFTLFSLECPVYSFILKSHNLHIQVLQSCKFWVWQKALYKLKSTLFFVLEKKYPPNSWLRYILSPSTETTLQTNITLSSPHDNNGNSTVIFIWDCSSLDPKVLYWSVCLYSANWWQIMQLSKIPKGSNKRCWPPKSPFNTGL